MKNQQEFPNEDLMYFDRELLDFEKALVTKYTKNEEMLNLLVQDKNFIIREILASRKGLPDCIVDKLVADPIVSVRECLVQDYPLSKEHIKFLAKDWGKDVAHVLFSNQNINIDNELIDYFVKYGSQRIKEQLVNLRYPLTDEQIEYLLAPIHNNIDIKCSLVMFYKLSEKTLFNLLKTNHLKLLSKIAYRNDLTIPMIVKLIDKSNDSLKFDLILNKSLLSIAPQIYQDLVSKVLRDSNPKIVKQTLHYYIRNLSNDLTLSKDVLLHLVELNYKNGDKELADLILHIPDIPQYMIERVAFDSAINYLFEINFKGNKKYYDVGAKTPHFSLTLAIKDYVQKVGYVQPIPRF